MQAADLLFGLPLLRCSGTCVLDLSLLRPPSRLFKLPSSSGISPCCACGCLALSPFGHLVLVMELGEESSLSGHANLW